VLITNRKLSVSYLTSTCLTTHHLGSFARSYAGIYLVVCGGSRPVVHHACDLDILFGIVIAAWNYFTSWFGLLRQ